jgi:hypothetical protein
MDEDSLMRKILVGELHYAKLWVICIALRGVSWDKMPFEQRELAFQAKDAAINCLSIFLTSPAYRYLIYHWLLLYVASHHVTPCQSRSSLRRSRKPHQRHLFGPFPLENGLSFSGRVGSWINYQSGRTASATPVRRISRTVTIAFAQKCLA